MRIALDYDGTYTADPELWGGFVASAMARGHEVYIVTMRYAEEGAEIEYNLKNRVTGIMYTSRMNKATYVFSQQKLMDIWIDDQPHFIFEDAKP